MSLICLILVASLWSKLALDNKQNSRTAGNRGVTFPHPRDVNVMSKLHPGEHMPCVLQASSEMQSDSNETHLGTAQ